MMEQPKILVLAGSARLDSFHRKLARQTVEALQDAGLEATLADLRDFPMPIYDGDLEAGEGIPPGRQGVEGTGTHTSTASPSLRRNTTARSLPC